MVFTRSASGVARSRLGVRLVSFGVVTKLPAEYSEFARFQSECGRSGPEYTRSSIGFARSANGVARSRLGVRLVSVGVRRHGLIQTAFRRPSKRLWGKENTPGHCVAIFAQSSRASSLTARRRSGRRSCRRSPEQKSFLRFKKQPGRGSMHSCMQSTGCQCGPQLRQDQLLHRRLHLHRRRRPRRTFKFTVPLT